MYQEICCHLPKKVDEPRREQKDRNEQRGLAQSLPSSKHPARVNPPVYLLYAEVTDKRWLLTSLAISELSAEVSSLKRSRTDTFLFNHTSSIHATEHQILDSAYRRVCIDEIDTV